MVKFEVKQDNEWKLKDIEEIRNLWRGGFISELNAVSRISDVLNDTYTVANDIKIFDKNGNIIQEAKAGTIRVSTR